MAELRVSAADAYAESGSGAPTLLVSAVDALLEYRAPTALLVSAADAYLEFRAPPEAMVSGVYAYVEFERPRATRASLKRRVDAAGDAMLMYKVGDAKAHAVALADDSGNVLGITINRLYVELADATATEVLEYNLVLENANTEYSQSLPSGCHKVTFRCRDATSTLRYAWTSGKVATPTAPYSVLPPGADYAVEITTLTGKTLYFASDTAGAVVEIEVWR